MFSRSIAARLMARTSTLALTGALFAVGAGAADAIGGGIGTGVETVVITGTKFNAEAAPAKASVNTTEPQTIITKNYIENFATATADYTTILAIAPSLTGLDVNGPGLSDGNVKNTLRGLPDGSFGMTYDGIPFGDTNGPTHHSASYFPGTTIGSINVERGPGNAGNLGASTYGGSVNMYSEVLNPDMGFKASATRGSWNTGEVNLNFQSGDIEGLGKTRVLADVSSLQTDGYLTNQELMKDNELLKVESEFAPGWTLTLFANRNNLHQHVNDKNGASAAQVAAFGKQYSLQKTDPTAPDYYAYNYADKITDMDYIRLRGAVTDWLSIDDEAYTYAYVNKTVTATDTRQTAAKIGANSWNVIGTKLVNTTTGATTTLATDVPGYTKLNAYRVWGNVFRAAADFEVGSITGQVRAGVWWEGQATERQRYYYDVTKCAAANCSPFKEAWNFADVSNKGASNDPSIAMGRYGAGYLEHTGWNQVSPFVEIEVQPIENLTITPGFKYVNWDHTIDPNSVISGTTTSKASGCVGACKGPTTYNGTVTTFTTTRPLYFTTANYKIEPNWSAYFQFATGIYVSDITDFEQQKPDWSKAPAPMTTTNYQLGTVYYADNFSIDADVYYIAAKNNYTYGPCSYDNSLTCPTNTGDATYKGIEGETTYKFDDMGLDGLLIFANGSVNSAKSLQLASNTGVNVPYQLKTAPYWTAAAGLIYEMGPVRISLIDKTVGQQYMDAPDSKTGYRTPGLDGQPFNRLPAYSTVNFSAAYKFAERFEISLAVNNLLDDRSLVSTSGADKLDIAKAASVSDYANRPTSTDQYYFQSSRSFQITLKAKI
ncbi:MAG: TonB-dependent receptor [Rhizomicrobium sp.]|nr:TonB-dependent receptor [Rhizomicrobium sp.]